MSDHSTFGSEIDQHASDGPGQAAAAPPVLRPTRSARDRDDAARRPRTSSAPRRTATHAGGASRRARVREQFGGRSEAVVADDGRHAEEAAEREHHRGRALRPSRSSTVDTVGDERVAVAQPAERAASAVRTVGDLDLDRRRRPAASPRRAARSPPAPPRLGRHASLGAHDEHDAGAAGPGSRRSVAAAAGARSSTNPASLRAPRAGRRTYPSPSAGARAVARRAASTPAVA